MYLFSHIRMKTATEGMTARSGKNIAKKIGVNGAHDSVTEGGILCGQTDVGQGFRHPLGIRPVNSAVCSVCVCVIKSHGWHTKTNENKNKKKKSCDSFI